jgi:hypothetical protein
MTKLPKKLERKLRSKRGVPLHEFFELHPDFKPLWDEYKAATEAVAKDAAARGITLDEYLRLIREKWQ